MKLSNTLIARGSRALALLALGALSTGALAVEVTLRELVNDMTDLVAATRMPTPFFTTHQASSYDRASKTPEDANGWFANGDAGRFLRIERTQGRIEFVMADLKGPGVVVRLWSANPMGAIRFYFDGESVPRIEKKMEDLLCGKVAPLVDPFGYMASSGANLYFPFPYAKSLKVTVEVGGKASEADDKTQWPNLYYHVGYRQYAPEVEVKSFEWSQLDPLADQIRKTGQKLLHPEPAPGGVAAPAVKATVKPGRSVTLLDANQQGAVVLLKVKATAPKAKRGPGEWFDPRQMHNVLRAARIMMDFDGERCVDVPLGDFFGSAPGINPFVSVPFDVAKDGTMVCRFVMPFAKTAKISVRNGGSVAFGLTAEARVAPYRWDARSMHFKAQWQAYRGSTRPMRDLDYLQTTGPGQFVGCHAAIANPVGGWWGEGDEKIYIDGETFPSTFGTGTEDFYGYAWCNPTPFIRPYHAQARCDGPANQGHTSVARWEILDRMPFANSFRFDMELWHWAETDVTYASTAYWYGVAGTPGPAKVNESLLAPPFIEGPQPVKGAIEGEKLSVAKKTGGVTEAQGGFADLSSGKQLWWRDAKPGDVLELVLPVAKAGRYELTGRFCFARDYGIHEIEVLGRKTQIDFFGDLNWRMQSLGVYDLPKGKVKVKVTLIGANPKADPRCMFGLDYFKLDPK